MFQNVFKLYDNDESGNLCAFKLHLALTSAGYKLNHHISNALVLRYGDREGQGSFVDFIRISYLFLFLEILCHLVLRNIFALYVMVEDFMQLSYIFND